VDTQTKSDGLVISETIENEVTIIGGRALGGYQQPGQRCFLDAQRREYPDGSVTYHLLLRSVSRDWLRIRPERSLHLVMGRDSVSLSGDGPSVRERLPDLDPRWWKKPHVTESQEYQISPRDLHRLADAAKVDVIVSGANRELNAHFGVKTFNTLRRFVKEYVDLYSFTVPANQEHGINTGIFLEAGKQVSIAANGVVSYDSGRHHTTPAGLICTYAGIPVADQQLFKPTDYPHDGTYRTDNSVNGVAGSLFGWVAEYDGDSAFLIGERRVVRAPRDGYLYLAVNDALGRYGDNEGQFKVTIRVLK
jgi:hypothetical protein